MNEGSSAATEPAAEGRAAALDRATPASRDRYVDFLRAFSICAVVVGHWLLAAVHWKAGKVSGQNALEVVPGLWISTWLLQVMPIFFFVGGFSNFTSFRSVRRRGGDSIDFIQRRFGRLVRPTAIFLSAWSAIVVTFDLIGVNGRALSLITKILGQPLWFVGIYMIVVALAPAMLKLHTRLGVAAPVALGFFAMAVDVASIGFKVPYIGNLNFPAVFLLAHQLGFFYADGRLIKLSKTRLILLAAGGLGAMILLTTLGPYAASMVGLSGERSNVNPPTIVLVALTLWQVALALLTRSGVTRWLQRPRVWAGVVTMNSVVMTVFLWHETAMLLGVLAVYPLGFPQPAAGAAAWWALRPVWLFILGAFLTVLVYVFGRFEREDGSKPAEPAAEPVEAGDDRSGAMAGARLRRRLMTTLGAIYLTVGILGFAVGGFAGFASSRGSTLIVFHLNPLACLIQFFIGAALMATWTTRPAGVARVGAGAGLQVAGAVALVTLAVTGAIVAGRRSANFLSVNPAGNLLNAAGAVLVLAALIAGALAPQATRR